MNPSGMRMGMVGVVSLGLSTLAATAQAANWADKTLINGFMSAVYSKTNEDLFFNGDATEAGINNDGSFQGTRYGLNIRSQVSDRVTLASQFIGSIKDQNYAAHVDWAFIGLKLNDEFTLRAGKIKYPVGLVNEYVAVGNAFPWISPPVLFYGTNQNGPQATREAYTGASLLWGDESGDWSLSSDLFGGEVDLDGGMKIKSLVGLSVGGEWNDMLAIKASTYKGTMKFDDPTIGLGPMMDGKTHKASTLGAKLEWDDLIAYTEYAKVTMGMVNMMGMPVNNGNSKTYYMTLGYHLGDWLPHVTYQNWSRDNGNGNQITTLGLRYDVDPATSVKLEVSNIATDNKGIFDGTPTGDVSMYSLAVDVVF